MPFGVAPLGLPPLTLPPSGAFPQLGAHLPEGWKKKIAEFTTPKPREMDTDYKDENSCFVRVVRPRRVSVLNI
jgi:hypothetical protein